MADDTARDLVKRMERAFEDKGSLDSLNQEIALNFYPARADYTGVRTVGAEFAADLFDSEPVRCCRDLADARSAMLRPDGQEWVKAEMSDPTLNDDPAIRRALDEVNKEFRNFLENPLVGYAVAEKEADYDVVSVGHAIKSGEVEIDRDGVLKPVIRCWHPRDFAWYNDVTNVKQDVIFRKFKLPARHIREKFKKATLSSAIENALKNNPDQDFDLCHCVMPVAEYDWHKKPAGAKGKQWASVYFDVSHRMILREDAETRFKYNIDGWMRWPGTQYFYSPSALTALPDARSLQAMAMALLEAAEKSLDPPLQAIKGVIKSAIDQRAGSITFTDKQYDGSRPAIEPLLPSDRNIPIGVDLIVRTVLALRDDWYLSNLHLPQQSKTAYETQVLFEQFIRSNLPLFGPWQNGINSMLEDVWYIMFEVKHKEFARKYQWPRELFGHGNAEIVFTFTNPLRNATERNRINQANQVVPVIVGAAQIDQAALHVLNVPEMLRDVIHGVGAPATWVNDEDRTAANIADDSQAKKFLGALGVAGQIADVAKTGTEAAVNLQQAAQAAPAANGEIAFGPT